MEAIEQSKLKMRIAVLEDSAFYNRLLRKQLENFTRELGREKDVDFVIESYLHAEDFLLNLKDNIDILFTDYYLGDNVTCPQIITKIKQHCPDCQIAVISRQTNFKTSMLPLVEGADMFIKKDAEALKKVSYFVEYVLSSKMLRKGK